MIVVGFLFLLFVCGFLGVLVLFVDSVIVLT